MGFESTTPVKARVFILLYLVIIKHLAKIFEKKNNKTMGGTDSREVNADKVPQGAVYIAWL